MTDQADVRIGLQELARPILGMLHDPEPGSLRLLHPPARIHITAMHCSQGKVWLKIRPRARGYGPLFFFRKDKDYELRIHGDDDRALLGPLVARSIAGTRRLAVIFEVPVRPEDESTLRDLAQIHLL